MNQAEIPVHPQSFYERCKNWVLHLFQQDSHTVTPRTANADISTPEDCQVFATEQEGLKCPTALTDTETHGSHARHGHDVRNGSHSQPPYPVAVPAQPRINSFATQFQGAHNFSISGNPTFTNIGVNNGVNNINTVNNNGPVHVDNRGRQHYDIKIDKQYGDTNLGDNQHINGSTYNFKGHH